MRDFRTLLALLFVVALNKFSLSQITFVNVSPDSCICVLSTTTNSYNILMVPWDLDNDGTNDFLIQSEATYQDANHNYDYTRIIPLNNNKVAGDSGCINCGVFRLNAGDVINTQPTWLTNSPLLVGFVGIVGWNGYWHWYDTSHYAGVKFYSGSTLNYGWIQLRAVAGSNGEAEVLITEYAYSPGSISAGQGSTTAIKENVTTNVLHLYPNPNNGSFKIDAGKNIQNGELILFNTIGQKVHVQKLTSGENIITIHDLPSGLYTYSLLQNKQQIEKGKFIIE